VAAMGVDAHRLKLAVFVLAGASAALAGALYADYLSFISPAAFDVLLGVQLVVMVVVGGAAGAWGPLLGAVGITAAVKLLPGVVPLVVPGARGPVELVGLSLQLGLITIVRPAVRRGKSVAAADANTVNP
jgi:branched-chain amino acid transport system permease protein